MADREYLYTLTISHKVKKENEIEWRDTYFVSAPNYFRAEDHAKELAANYEKEEGHTCMVVSVECITDVQSVTPRENNQQPLTHKVIIEPKSGGW